MAYGKELHWSCMKLSPLDSTPTPTAATAVDSSFPTSLASAYKTCRACLQFSWVLGASKQGHPILLQVLHALPTTACQLSSEEEAKKTDWKQITTEDASIHANPNSPRDCKDRGLQLLEIFHLLYLSCTVSHPLISDVRAAVFDFQCPMQCQLGTP